MCAALTEDTTGREALYLANVAADVGADVAVCDAPVGVRRLCTRHPLDALQVIRISPTNDHTTRLLTAIAEMITPKCLLLA